MLQKDWTTMPLNLINSFTHTIGHNWEDPCVDYLKKINKHALPITINKIGEIRLSIKIS